MGPFHPQLGPLERAKERGKHLDGAKLDMATCPTKVNANVADGRGRCVIPVRVPCQLVDNFIMG